jgi:F-type H+-transporting ATPase subunit delta
MSASVSSKRYAQAIFQIARDRNELEEWQTNLGRIADLMQNPDFAAAVDNPKLPFELKAKITQEGLGKINPLALNLAYLLILKNKFKRSGQIAREYDQLLDEYRGIMRAEITTAVPLSDSDKKNLGQRLETMMDSKLHLEYSVDPAIIGGIIARIKGSLIDGSVRSKLEIMKKNLAGSS